MDAAALLVAGVAVVGSPGNGDAEGTLTVVSSSLVPGGVVVVVVVASTPIAEYS